MIKYIKMFTLIILVTLLSGCTLENIFNREKPNSNYYTYELSNLISDNSFEIHILDRNVYRNISVTNEDLSILDDLLKNIKDSNYLLETPDDLPSKPIYTLFITTEKEKMILDVYGDDLISIYPWDGKYEKDYLSLKDIQNAFKMEQFCEYIFEKAKSQ